MTLSDSDTFRRRMQQEADEQRAEVMDAHLGDNVTAPRGGEPCIVAAIYPDGGRLVSHGGSYPADFIGWCRCESEPDARYFEFVGGREDGSHGWYDARCSRVFQWG